jgi:CRISPR-associated protein Csx10
MALTVEGRIEPARLREIEAAGIGERTAEGYGQIRFNDPLLVSAPRQQDETKGKTVKHQPKTSALPASDVYARLLEREVWKQEIRRTALQIAGNRTHRQDALKWDAKHDKPSMSQLGGLRGQLAQLRGEADVQAIVGWLDQLAQNPRRAKNWPRDAIGRVRDLLGQRQQVWDKIKCEDWPTLTEGAATRLRNELWCLAVRTLFDACIRAHKRELESGGR